MQLFYRSLRGELKTLSVDPFDRILHLRLLINKIEGIAPHTNLCLHCCGAYLPDSTADTAGSTSLSDYNIQNEATINSSYSIGRKPLFLKNLHQRLLLSPSTDIFEEEGVKMHVGEASSSSDYDNRKRKFNEEKSIDQEDEKYEGVYIERSQLLFIGSFSSSRVRMRSEQDSVLLPLSCEKRGVEDGSIMTELLDTSKLSNCQNMKRFSVHNFNEESRAPQSQTPWAFLSQELHYKDDISSSVVSMNDESSFINVNRLRDAHFVQQQIKVSPFDVSSRVSCAIIFAQPNSCTSADYNQGADNSMQSWLVQIEADRVAAAAAAKEVEMKKEAERLQMDAKKNAASAEKEAIVNVRDKIVAAPVKLQLSEEAIKMRAERERKIAAENELLEKQRVERAQRLKEQEESRRRQQQLHAARRDEDRRKQAELARKRRK